MWQILKNIFRIKISKERVNINVKTEILIKYLSMKCPELLLEYAFYLKASGSQRPWFPWNYFQLIKINEK